MKGCPQAAGESQSPINIDTHGAIFDIDLPTNMHWSNDRLGSAKLSNTGHGFQVQMQSDVVLTGGPLTGDYVFKQFHMHWGLRDGWGSEHTLDGRSFPAELHIVHMNRKYNSMKEAQENADGLAVVSFFFELGAPNAELAQVFSSLHKVQYRDETLDDLRPIRFTNFLANVSSTHGDDYYTYSGSLTTPPCAECVTWIVMARQLTLSADQLEHMRQTCVSRRGEKEARCVDNFRPPVPLGTKRVVRTTVLH